MSEDTKAEALPIRSGGEASVDGLRFIQSILVDPTTDKAYANADECGRLMVKVVENLDHTGIMRTISALEALARSIQLLQQGLAIEGLRRMFSDA